MGHLGTVSRPALPRKALVGLFAAFVSLALLPCAVALAAADTYATGFEDFGPGNVSTQHGWMSPNPPNPSDSSGCLPSQPFSIDQGIVSSGGVHGFGSQSLRFSNLCHNTAFGPPATQIYSPLLDSPAGENEDNHVFTAEFSFIPTTLENQPNLYVSVSPDNGTGWRMDRVDLTSTKGGVLVSIVDAPGVDNGDLEAHDFGPLDPRVPHTIKLWMQFNPGPNNDIVRVSIDGTDTGQCFASWENYYRANQPGNFQNTSDLQFRAALGGFDIPMAGYLFDNVSYTSSNGPAPPSCDLPIEKQADSPTVTAGGLAGYRLTVRNRGRLTERNLLLCDHIPKHTTFANADRKLRRIGRRRCLFIRSLAPGRRASVHLRLRVSANAPQGNLDNIADITPESPPTSPAAPPVTTEDLPPSAATVPPKPIEKVTTAVKVVAKKKVVEPPPPVVTG